jgi:predicted porin
LTKISIARRWSKASDCGGFDSLARSPRRNARDLGQNAARRPPVPSPFAKPEMPRPSRFLRAVLAAGAACLCSFGSQAQNAILYGLIDASGSHVKEVGGQSSWRLESGNLQYSYIGFRGAEDLGGGLRAVFRLESYVSVDSGSAGRSPYVIDPFWAREASVGFSGSFGTTVLGRTESPLSRATTNFNPFGESAGFSPSARQYFGARGAILGDSRWSNSVSYTNNTSDAPLRINFAANLPEELPGVPEQHRNYGLSVAYITGPFAVVVAGEKIQNSALALPAGFDRQMAYQIGATYDFSFLRVYGQVGRVKTEADVDVQTILYQLGGTIPVGNGFILVAYGNSHIKTSVKAVTDKTASIGYDYFLSKRTDIYVAAMVEKLSFTSSGNGFAGGVRMRF